VDVDPELRAREILEKAKRLRKPTPRWLVTWAIIVTVICLGALAIGVVRHEL
jgi:hypothetical protein